MKLIDLLSPLSWHRETRKTTAQAESVKCYTNPVLTPSNGDVTSLSQHLMQEPTKLADDVFAEEVAFPAICQG